MNYFSKRCPTCGEIHDLYDEKEQFRFGGSSKNPFYQENRDIKPFLVTCHACGGTGYERQSFITSPKSIWPNNVDDRYDEEDDLCRTCGGRGMIYSDEY